MKNLSLEEWEIDKILEVFERKLEKINKKEIDENQIQMKKEFEEVINHIKFQVEQ